MIMYFINFSAFILFHVLLNSDVAPTHSRRNHRYSHPQNNTILTFDSFGDDIFGDFANNGFTSFSSFNSSFGNMGGGGGGGGGMGNGAVKRTSTATTFVNGKKLMTKK